MQRVFRMVYSCPLPDPINSRFFVPVQGRSVKIFSSLFPSVTSLTSLLRPEGSLCICLLKADRLHATTAGHVTLFRRLSGR